jgi:hypothetical protein
MMLEHDVMLPNANFEEFNPDIEGRDRLKVLVCPPMTSTMTNQNRYLLSRHIGHQTL